MTSGEHHIAFGPVPSRRLGRSLGINNVTTKACSYTCLYCQVGPTTEKIVEPRPFFTPGDIRQAVETRVDRILADGGHIDYLSFVPDGEPTLDIRLGEAIDSLRTLGIPIAVITNATLLWRAEVRERIARADLVSVKVDSVIEPVWRRINLPHKALDLDRVLQGIREFASAYGGTLISDTMLLRGINDDEPGLTATAGFLADIAPGTAYLAIPTRPTTVEGVQGTDEAGLIRAHEIFAGRLPRVELLTSMESEDFAHTGAARDDLLAVTAVHPMRESAVRRMLEADHAGWELVESLLAEGELRMVEYRGERFYLRPVSR